MQMKKRIQAAYTKLKVHRWIAWLLCAALMCSMVSSTLPALAIDGEKEDTLCEHHPEHTGDCGYAEAVEGQPCTHIHDDQCGYVGGGSTAIECTHVHDEECGYVKAVEGKSCQFVCAVCGGLEEVTDEETEQDVAVMADELIAPRAVQEEGLIAEFRFDSNANRLYDYSGKGVTARLHRVAPGDTAVKEQITDLDGYFDEGALHLQDNAYLVLDENGDYFDDMTELTVEMRIKIEERENPGAYIGGDANWLFYAAQPGNPNPGDTKCLGVTLTNDRKLRILRQKLNSADGLAEEVFPNDDPFQFEKWYTIRIIYKPSNVALYVNNKRIVDHGMGDKTSEYFYKGGELWFGHSAWPNDSSFNGYIDDIKIYNYAYYNKSGGGYLDGYIDEQKYILKSVAPPQTLPSICLITGSPGS